MEIYLRRDANLKPLASISGINELYTTLHTRFITLKAIANNERDTSSSINAGAAESLEKDLQRTDFMVCIIGEFSRGKSTFVNALLGDNVLPAKVRPTTAVITVISDGDPARLTAYFRDARKPPTEMTLGGEPAKEIMDLVTVGNVRAGDIDHVELFYPNRFTRMGIKIVDTPGVNDMDEVREEITYRYLPLADATIMLLDPMQPISASEMAFLRDKVLPQSIEKMFFVVNKIDQVSEEDREKSIRYIRSQLEGVVRKVEIFGVNSRGAMKAKISGDLDLLKATGFPELEARLDRFLCSGEALSLLATRVRRVYEYSTEIEQGMKIRLQALESREANASGKVEAAKQRLITQSKASKKLIDCIRTEVLPVENSLRDRVQADFSNARAEANRSLEYESNLKTVQSEVKSIINRTRRNLIDTLNSAAQSEVEKLWKKYETEASRIGENIRRLSVSGTELAVRGASGESHIDLDLASLETSVQEERSFTTSAIGITAVAYTIFALATGNWLYAIGALAGGLIAGEGVSQAYDKTMRQQAKTRVLNAINNAERDARPHYRETAGKVIELVVKQLTGPLEERAGSLSASLSGATRDLSDTVSGQAATKKDLSERLRKLSCIQIELREMIDSLRRL